MNYSMAIFLINNHARAILGRYDPATGGPLAKPTMFKTLDTGISVDDFVIVESDTRHGMTIVKVEEVDVDVDFDSTEVVRWVIGRVDRSNHDLLLAQEQEAISAMKSAELRKKRAGLREAMLADSDKEILALPISSINGDDEATYRPPDDGPL